MPISYSDGKENCPKLWAFFLMDIFPVHHPDYVLTFFKKPFEELYLLSEISQYIL